MINVGVIDRLLRLIALHFFISVLDNGIVQSDSLLKCCISIVAFYVLVSAIVGIDPIYHFLKIDTKEDLINNKTVKCNDSK
jgi:hypothetical protein